MKHRQNEFFNGTSVSNNCQGGEKKEDNLKLLVETILEVWKIKQLL